MDSKLAPEYELYMSIIDQVTSDTTNEFFDDEEEQCDLQALKDLWKEKLVETKVVEPDRLSTFSGLPLNLYPPVHARQQSNHGPAMPKYAPVSTISALMNIRLPKPQPIQNQSKVSTQNARANAPSIINPKPVKLLTTVRAANPPPVSHVVAPQPRPFVRNLPFRNVSQFDGPAEVEIMDDFFLDDDDDEEELTFNDNEESVFGDDDGDAEIHDIDDETPPSMDEIEDLFDCTDVVVCSYDSISSKKGRFRINLASGILLCKGKECVFSHAKGETDLCALKKSKNK